MIILRLYSIVKLQEEDFSATNGKTGYEMLCIIKLRNFIKSYKYYIQKYGTLTHRKIAKYYGELHLLKIAYREITEYLHIVKLRNVTKRYRVLRYIGLRRV